MSRTARPWFSRMSQQAVRYDLPRVRVVNASTRSKGSTEPEKTKPEQGGKFVVGKSLVGGKDVVG